MAVPHRLVSLGLRLTCHQALLCHELVRNAHSPRNDWALRDSSNGGYMLLGLLVRRLDPSGQRPLNPGPHRLHSERLRGRDRNNRRGHDAVVHGGRSLGRARKSLPGESGALLDE